MRLIISLLSMTCLALPAIAQDTLTGDEIVAQMNARDDGNYVTRGFSIELTDRSGKTRTEKTIAYRRYFGDEKRTIIFYTEPTRVRGTGFLTYDYADLRLMMINGCTFQHLGKYVEFQHLIEVTTFLERTLPMKK